MLYIIKSDENLFNRWRVLENKFDIRLLSGLVQNSYILNTEILNEHFTVARKVFNELFSKYTHAYLSGVANEEGVDYISLFTTLEQETGNYIKELNKGGFTETTWREFSFDCASRQYGSKDLGNSICHIRQNLKETNPVCSMDRCPILIDVLQS